MNTKHMPLWIRRLYAHVFGYFWLPCPICNCMFGGNEWENGATLLNDHFSGVGVCPSCKAEAQRRNARLTP
jgi:hypothetical protein